MCNMEEKRIIAAFGLLTVDLSVKLLHTCAVITSLQLAASQVKCMFWLLINKFISRENLECTFCHSKVLFDILERSAQSNPI